MSTIEIDNLMVDNIDTQDTNTLVIGDVLATKIELADTGVITEVKGNLDALEGIDVTGNATLTGYTQFTDIGSPAAPGAGLGRLYKKTGDDGLWWRPDTGGEVDLTDTGAGGETNTASNVGAGADIFKQKTGVNLEFRGILAASSKVSAAVNSDNIDIDIVEANINHDSLSGFVSNEHIDHSSVTLTAGIGLAGGGDITTNRTFDLDIDELTETTTIDQTADFLAVYDADGAGNKHRKVKPSNLVKVRDYYDVIADPSGAGDYTTVAAAFASGAQSVFARDGTYLETADIIIPDGGHLIGESMDQTIINFQSAAFGIKIDGNSGTSETAGTITATHLSSAIVGVGTTFTNISLPCFILIDQNFYPVASITDNTNLTIGPVYRGPTKAGASYRLQQMKSSVIANNFTVIGSTVSAMYIRAVRHAEFEDIVLRGNSVGIEVIASGNTNFQTIMCQNESSNAYVITDTASCVFEGCQAFNSGGHGYLVNGHSTDVEFSTCQGSHSVSNGIYVTGTSTDITINGCIFNNNKLDGIETASGTYTCTINGCAMNGNGLDGIDFDGTNNVVDACIIGNNGRYGIRAGDGGTISNNHVFENANNGIELEADDKCQVVGNYVHNNVGDGIYTDMNDNTITGNVVISNVHGVLIDGGVGGGHRNLVSNNVLKDNSDDGICVTASATFNKISGNHIKGNTDGIELKTNCHNTTIVNNTCEGNSAWGIIVEGNYCIVNSNRVTANTSGGIKIDTGYTDVTYYSNNTQGNTGPDFSDLGTITSSYEAVLANELEARSATTLVIGASTATKVEIADTGVITEVQGNLDALGGIDVTGNATLTGYAQFADITSPANAGAGLGRLYKKTGDDGIWWKPDAGGSEVDLTATGASGETNTASNVGSGADIFKQKTGVDLEFRGINAASSKVSAAVNGDNIDIDIVTGNIDHGGLSGLADDDHSQYLLLAGRSSGQTANGGTAASENLTLDSTAHATKGYIVHLSNLKAPDGTSLLPSYTFSNDPDTGMYREVSGDLAFAQDGTCVFEIQTDNRLIISADVPNYETLVTADNVIPNKKYVDDKTWDTSDITTGTFANARIAQSNVTQHESAITHQNLSGAGTNTHAQIDSHISATAAHGATGAVMGTTNTQTVTNKTLTATSNNVAAKSLHSATTVINVSAATAPTSGQILTATGGTAATWQAPASKSIRQGQTWAIAGEIKVPSGDTDFLVPFYVSLATGQTSKIVSARHRINSGTSVTIKVQKNGVDVTGFTGISVTTTDTTTDPADVALANNDKLAVIVTGVSGTPKNLSFTLFLEHTV